MVSKVGKIQNSNNSSPGQTHPQQKEIYRLAAESFCRVSSSSGRHSLDLSLFAFSSRLLHLLHRRRRCLVPHCLISSSRPAPALLQMASSDLEAATALKVQGNKAFAQHDWPTALDYYSQAIAKYDQEPSFFSNRAQVYSGPGRMI